MHSDNNNRISCVNLSVEGFPDSEDAVWDRAAKATLVDVKTGDRAFLHTEFSVFSCDKQQKLYFRFCAEDDEWHSCFRLHDEPLYRQDVFEIFICDDNNLKHYLELEASPHDIRFDGVITYDEQNARHLNTSVDVKGWATYTVRDRSGSTTTSVWALPYGVFENPPKAGEFWRINVFSIDHRRRGEALLAWQKTGENNFHVPERFGFLDFVDESSR